MGGVEEDQVCASDSGFDKGLESDRVVCSEYTDVMSVAEESCASFEGLEFGGGIVSVDGDGVPEVGVKVLRKDLLTRQERARSYWERFSAMSCVSSKMSNTLSLGAIRCT